MQKSKLAKFMNLYRSYVKSRFVPSAFSVRMIPTDKCNLNCSYCWQKRDESYEMTLAEFDSYVAKAKSLNTGIITFLGGEPMTWPYLYDALESCSRANILTDLTTNGTLLNSKTIDRLGASGLDYLNISVDGTSPNNVTRKNSVFRPDILDCLKDARKNHKMHFRINSVIYKNNFEQIRSLLEFAKSRNVQISLGYVVPEISVNLQNRADIYFTAKDEGLLNEIIEYIITKKKQGYPIIDPAEYFTGIFRFLKKEKFWDCNYPTRYGWINVSPDGRIRSCTKKMDELDFKFLELDEDKLLQLRQVLARNVQTCNVHCYSNCAFDSYFYTHHKSEILNKVFTRIFVDVSK
jgi:MoaA/NifB/PqqE/SkfB family radical SAM enzyme